MLWVDDPANEAQIMWMFGPAGAGKSAIAQSIAEMCFEQEKLVASFFFSRNASGRNNETRFISTLVYQLVLAISEIQDSVNKALEDDRLLFSRSLHVQAQKLIIKPLNDLLLTSNSENGFQNTRPRLIIVDGLDECGKVKNQRHVLDVLIPSIVLRCQPARANHTRLFQQRVDVLKHHSPCSGRHLRKQRRH